MNCKEFTNPTTGISNFILISRKFLSSFHSLINPSQEPDAIRSVLTKVAMDVIQLATPVGDIPCANLKLLIGRFLLELHTQSVPSSPHDRKVSSLINLTQSILPKWPALKTSCDSSTIFHILSVPSHPPEVSARSFCRASMEVIGF